MRINRPIENTTTVFEDGDYPFTILEMNEIKFNSIGIEEMPIKLEFTNRDGKTVVIHEHLVFTEKAAFKINQFLAAINIPAGTRINFRDPEVIKHIRAKTGAATLVSEPTRRKAHLRNRVAKFLYGGTSIIPSFARSRFAI